MQTLAEWLPQNEKLGHCILNIRRLGALSAQDVQDLHDFLWNKRTEAHEALTKTLDI